MAGFLGIVFRDRTLAEGLRSGAVEFLAKKRCVFSDRFAALFDLDIAPAATGAAASISGSAFIWRGSLCNRSSLASELSLGTQHTDEQIAQAAFERWGKDSPRRLLGDWCFAAWNAAQRTLFLARDQMGNSALFYHADSTCVVFSTSRRALLDLKLIPSVAIDELYLAQILISWPAYHGERTIHNPIRRLPPAHQLVVTPSSLTPRRYWHLEDVPELQLSSRADYATGLREILDQAVRERLPADGRVAIALSGGLDSSSVAVTAASFLAGQNRTLTAYTSTPIGPPASGISERFTDEYPFAEATAAYGANIILNKIDASNLSPIEAIKRGLSTILEPVHSAANLFWMMAMHQTAALSGHAVLLNGEMGNAGLSWPGDSFSQSLLFQLRNDNLNAWLKKRAKQFLPHSVTKLMQNRRQPSQWLSTAISSDFADRMRLKELRASDAWEQAYKPPLMERLYTLKPGRSNFGCFHAELDAAGGLSTTDPTADVRVLEYCLSIPDRIFVDPTSGMNRWLIREAMKDRLPDAVRLNRKRGLQAADMVPRLCAAAGEVESALEDCERGPAAEYLNVPYLRSIWSKMRAGANDRVTYKLAVTALTRGLMAGLFVNGFGKTW